MDVRGRRERKWRKGKGEGKGKGLVLTRNVAQTPNSQSKIWTSSEWLDMFMSVWERLGVGVRLVLV